MFCFSDLGDHIWIGGYSSQTDSGDLDISGDAFFSRSASSDRIGRLFALTENENAFQCVLVCSWCPRHEDRDHLPKPAPLPLNLHDGGYPVAMTMDGDDRLWCVDSVGRLMIFRLVLSVNFKNSTSSCLNHFTYSKPFYLRGVGVAVNLHLYHFTK